MSHKKALLEILHAQGGDNLARAWAAFRGLDYLDMCRKRDALGRSGFDVLADHILAEQRHHELIAWVQNLPEEE